MLSNRSKVKCNTDSSRKDVRCRSKKYPQNNWQNSSTTTTKRSARILAARASQTLKHGSKYHTRKRVVLWLLSVWHYWNWPPRLENGKSQDAISQSPVKLNGVADMEGFVAHFRSASGSLELQHGFNDRNSATDGTPFQ